MIASIRKQLPEEHEMVVTANGKPFAILTSVRPDEVEEQLQAIRRARGRVALDRIRAHAKARGLDHMSMAEIDALIAQARSDRQRTQGKRR